MSDLGRLKDRTAIVTGGGTSGDIMNVGRAISLLFAREGARVAVVDRSGDAAESTVREISSEGGTACAVVADVSNAEDCAKVVGAIPPSWGPVQILVNNVGITDSGVGIAELSEQDWMNTMDVNAKSVFLMSKHVLPVMQDGGSVINISSVATARPGNGSAYGASKAAVEALTLAIATQFGHRGIRSNCIAPGAMWTAMAARRFATQEDADRSRQARTQRPILPIEGTAWDPAHTAMFLASDDSRWITGQVIFVDGGEGLRTPGVGTSGAPKA